jgi:hypothetical protein
MGRIRSILLTDYIGAITIGFVVAQAVTAFIGAFIAPFDSYWQLARRHDVTGGPAPVFSWQMLTVGLVSSALYALIALLLAKWLYGPGASSGPDISASS